MARYLIIEGRRVPEPQFEHDVEKLMNEYRRAILRIKNELQRVDLTDFQRANMIAMMKSIEDALAELDKFARGWVSATLPEIAKKGAAAALVELGLVKTFEEALKIAKFNKLNKEMVKLYVSDTHNDILEVTNNVSRRIRNTMRKIAGEVMRANMAEGVNSISTHKQMMLERLRKELADAIETGIIDRAGRRWKPEDYVDMLTKTKSLEMYRIAKTNEAVARGAYYGLVQGPPAKDACRFFIGSIIKLVPNAPGDYPTYEELKSSNLLFHPRCHHYFTVFRDFNLLPEDVQQTAVEQTQRGNAALSIGKRNVTDEQVNSIVSR